MIQMLAMNNNKKTKTERVVPRISTRLKTKNRFDLKLKEIKNNFDLGSFTQDDFINYLLDELEKSNRGSNEP